MRRKDKNKITLKRRLIVNNLLDLEGVLDYLITKQVFTAAMCQRISFESSVPRDRVRQTLDYLVTRGPTSFKIFLEALVLTGNIHIVRELDSEYVDSDECKNLIQTEVKSSIEATPSIYETYHHELPGRSLRHKSQSPVTLIRAMNRASSKTPEQIRSSFTASNSLQYQRNSPNLTGPMRTSRSRSHSRSQINFSNEEILALGGDVDITWDEINNLDLDFEVASSGLSDFTDDIIFKHYSNIADCYPMDIEPRGVCLIINNEHFYDHDGTEITDLRRFGTDMDASRLKNLFQQLKFHVKFELDLSGKMLRETIQEFARDCEINSHNYQAICVIILSHGTDGYIYGSDFDNKISMDKDVLNLFDHVLHNKPKLFIFQACRGDNINEKLHTSSNVEETISKFKEMKVNQTPPLPPSNRKQNCTQLEHKNNAQNLNNNFRKTSSFNNFIDGHPIRTRLPSRSDFFIWYSSVRGFVSHRDGNGSPFIKCLVGVFSRFSKDLELIEMVRKVNILMQQYEQINYDERNYVSSYFMLPAPEYHLTKKLYFNP